MPQVKLATMPLGNCIVADSHLVDAALVEVAGGVRLQSARLCREHAREVDAVAADVHQRAAGRSGAEADVAVDRAWSCSRSWSG